MRRPVAGGAWTAGTVTATALVLAVTTWAVGCGGSNEKGTPPPWANGGPSATTPPAATPAGNPGAAPPPGSQPAIAGQGATGIGEDPARSALLTRLRERKWVNEDFVESDTNRDPFHPFLVDIGQGELPTPQYEILMGKYSLDEVKLSMVVGPPERRGGGSRGQFGSSGSSVAPRAMFIDPTGMGHSVVRGNHISKADATVFRIDSDKGQVIVKLREELGNGKSREVERVLELHQGLEAVSP